METLGKEDPLGYSELYDLMKQVQEYILRKWAKTRKGVQQIMGGKVLESWRERTLREGRAEGHAEGRAEERMEQQKKLEAKVQAKIVKGQSVAQIAEELVEEISVIQPIYEKLVKSM